MVKWIKQLVLSCFCCSHCPKLCNPTASETTICSYHCLVATELLLCVITKYLKSKTKDLPFCKNDATLPCVLYSHFMEIHRIAIAFFIFFTLMCFITTNISSSRNDRSVVHNGFWFFKLLFIGLLIFGFTYVPYGVFDIFMTWLSYFVIFMYHSFELLGYCCILLSVATKAREAAPDQGFCKGFLCFFVVFFHVLGLIIAIYLLAAYSSCTLNIALICLNILLSYMVSTCMGFFWFWRGKKVEAMQGSVLICLTMVITWSALANNPRPECNPPKEMADISFLIVNYLSLLLAGIIATEAPKYIIDRLPYGREGAIVFVEKRSKGCLGVWGKPIIVNHIEPLEPPRRIVYTSTDEDDDEYEQAKYTWSIFHQVLAEFSIYLMFIMTENYNFIFKHHKVVTYHNEIAMWVKLASSWFSVLLFFFIKTKKLN